MIKDFFLYPFNLLWLLLIPIIILFYILKPKRENKIVSSILIWFSVTKVLEHSTPFQKLKRNISLLLQILIIILLSFALAEPYILKKYLKKNIIILIDNSASMQTLEKNGTRLEIAKRKAIQIIKNLTKDKKVMIICFGENIKIIQRFTNNKEILIKKIKQIKTTDSRTFITPGLKLSYSILNKQKDSQVFIISDGAFLDKRESLNLIKKNKNIKTIFLKIGENKSNVAIINMNFQNQGNYYNGIIKIKNFNNENIEGFLKIIFYYKNKKKKLKYKYIYIQPNDILNIMIENIDLYVQKLEIELNITKGKDYLKVDNKAYYCLNSIEFPLIYFISNKKNIFIETFFKSNNIKYLKYNFGYFKKLYYLNKINFDNQHLIIFDNITNNNINFEKGNFVYINCIPNIPNIEKNNKILKFLSIVDQNDYHPILRFLNLRDTIIRNALNIKFPENTISLLESKKNILMGLINYKNSENLVISFDIIKSSLVKDITFPILFINILNYFKNKIKYNYKIGENFQINIDDIKNINLLNKKNKLIKRNLIIPYEVGFYKINLKNNISLLYSVNLFSIKESNIKPFKIKEKYNNYFINKNNFHTSYFIFKLSHYFILIVFFILFVLFTWIY